MSPLRLGVTGASGFLGTSLLVHLAPRPDVQIVALTRTIGPEHAMPQANVEWRQADLASARDCAEFVADLDAIVHLAHTNTPLTSNKDLSSDGAMNIVPALTLLEAIRDVATKPHVVYASSGGALYRPTSDGRPLVEESALQPLTSYGILKLTIENYLEMGAHEGWLTSTVLRIGNPYGALLPSERLQGFIGVAVQQHLERRPIRIFGDLGNVRDYIHLDDLCHAFDLALVPRRAFDIYNVGSGVGTSVRDVLALLELVTGDVLTVERVEPAGAPARLPPWVVLDSTKAVRDLGWRPAVALADGIRAMWEGACRR